MLSKNSPRVVLLIVVACSICGCDFDVLKSLSRRTGIVGNTVTISDNVVTINVVTSQLPDNGTDGGGATGGFNDGTFPISTTPSTLPGDLHFRGTNHTSFLPPTAPSAVGNPF